MIAQEEKSGSSAASHIWLPMRAGELRSVGAVLLLSLPGKTLDVLILYL